MHCEEYPDKQKDDAICFNGNPLDLNQNGTRAT